MMVHMTTLEKMINEIDPEKIEEFAATIIANTNSRLDPRYLDFSLIDNISEFVYNTIKEQSVGYLLLIVYRRYIEKITEERLL